MTRDDTPIPPDHRSIISALSVETRRKLAAQTDLPGLIRISLHLCALAASAAYVAYGLPLWPLALVVEAVLLTFLFSPQHECIHNTAFRTDLLNRITAHICGCLILLAPQHFRYFHMAHHRYTHDPERDPELTTPKPSTLGAHLIYLSGLPTWIDRIKGLVLHACGAALPAYVPPRGQGRVRTEARIYLAIYITCAVVSISLSSTLLLWIWVLPNMIGQPLMRAYLLAEHTRCPHVTNMLVNTRTTFTNRLVRWLAWNMPFHIEHHAYPAVPFHRLPDLHAEIRDHLGSTSEGYMHFHAEHWTTLASGTSVLATNNDRPG